MNKEDDLVLTLLLHVGKHDDQASETAARAMAGREDLVPALILLLTDENGDRRWWGTRCLEVIGGREAERLLATQLLDSADDVRCVAAIALGRLRSEQHLGAIVERLADSSAWVRDSACDALAMMGDIAVPALAGALSDERQGVRVRAAGRVAPDAHE